MFKLERTVVINSFVCGDLQQMKFSTLDVIHEKKLTMTERRWAGNKI